MGWFLRLRALSLLKDRVGCGLRAGWGLRRLSLGLDFTTPLAGGRIWGRLIAMFAGLLRPRTHLEGRHRLVELHRSR